MAQVITVGHQQKDGRRFVLEVHTDARGEFARIEYLAAEGVDHNAIATEREPVLVEGLAEQEARDTVDNNVPPLPRFQTENQLLARVRRRYRDAVKEEACVISRWIVDRLDDGSITTAQCQVAWTVNAGGWNAINGRMDTNAAALASVNVAVGE